MKLSELTLHQKEHFLNRFLKSDEVISKLGEFINNNVNLFGQLFCLTSEYLDFGKGTQIFRVEIQQKTKERNDLEISLLIDGVVHDWKILSIERIKEKLNEYYWGNQIFRLIKFLFFEYIEDNDLDIEVGEFKEEEKKIKKYVIKDLSYSTIEIERGFEIFGYSKYYEIELDWLDFGGDGEFLLETLKKICNIDELKMFSSNYGFSRKYSTSNEKAFNLAVWLIDKHMKNFSKLEHKDKK